MRIKQTALVSANIYIHAMLIINYLTFIFFMSVVQQIDYNEWKTIHYRQKLKLNYT